MSLSQGKNELTKFYFKDLSSNMIENVTAFIAANIVTEHKSEVRLNFTIRFLVILSARTNSSYVSSRNIKIIQHEKKIVAAFLTIDIIEYLNVLEKINSEVMINNLVNVSGFEKSIDNLGGEKGQNLLEILAVWRREISEQMIRKEIEVLHYGFLLYKYVGWKNILFVTKNPVPFLKINASIVAEKQTETQKTYLVSLKFNQLALLSKKSRKTSLSKL